MNPESRLSRLIFVSPWPLLVFIVIPAVVVVSVKFHLQLPVANPTTMLLVNNALFACFVALRTLWYLSRMGKAVRYGSGRCRPRNADTSPLSCVEVRRVLSGARYAFTADGSYGEKRDHGYIGTTLFYIGLLVLLSVGTLDNLRQFSGTVLDGMGPATKLSRIDSYRLLKRGILATKLDSLPQLIITKQFFPDSVFPKGATEIALISDDNKEQKYLLVPGKPVRYGDYEIYMTKLVFEPQIVIKTRDSGTVFDAIVRLDPLVQKRGIFSFYGLFQGGGLGGGVYYQPEESNLMVVISRGTKKVVTDLVFQVDKQAVQGEYTLSCAKMGQWSEIHVVRRRHMSLLIVGAIIAVVGLLLRIAVRPQRVWLEETAEGCLVWSSGKETKGLLKTEN